jgi:hypothetical protein
MPTFDPEARPAPSGDGPTERVETSDTIPSGDYVIRAVWFDSKFGQQSQREYLRIKWEILAGEHAGTGFFGNLSCSVDVGPVAARWREMCKALGIVENFEIGGPDGIRDFARLFKNKPFRARVNRSESGNFVNYDIGSAYLRSSWSENEVAAAGDLAPQDTGGPPPDSDRAPF